MTTPDYRALCAELAEEVRHLWSLIRDDNNEAHPLAERARALLAAPEAVEVADEELREMWLSGEWFNEGATFREFASIVRRYGTAPPAPIPVSERLPEVEDCDEEGRCWWSKPRGYRGYNIVEHYWIYGDKECTRFASPAHWLPHWALPLPEVK